MPYIEKAGVKTVQDQLEQWKGVMHDPNIDGFNGFGCKQKIYQVLWLSLIHISEPTRRTPR